MKLSKDTKNYLLLVLVFVAIVAAFIAIPRIISGTNLPFAAVESGSMEPTIPTGSLIFIQKVSGADLVAGPMPVGDVVVFFFPNTQITDYWFRTVYDPTPWSHRAIAKEEINGTFYVLTQGDANAYPDENPNFPSTWVPMDRVIGRVVWWVPYLGYVFLWMHNPFVLLGIIILILIIIILPMVTKKEEIKADDQDVKQPINLYKAP